MMLGRFASRKALRPQACFVRLTPTGYRPPSRRPVAGRSEEIEPHSVSRISQSSRCPNLDIGCRKPTVLHDAARGKSFTMWVFYWHAGADKHRESSVPDPRGARAAIPARADSAVETKKTRQKPMRILTDIETTRRKPWFLNRGRSKISWATCRIPVRPFVYTVKAGHRPAR
jgi:hypothetical protein